MATAWLSLFGLLALIALFTFLTVNDRKDAANAVATRGQEQTLLLSEHAARLLEAAELSLSTVAEDAASLDWNAVATSPQLWSKVERRAKRLSYVEAFWLCGPDGRLRLTSMAFPAPPRDMRENSFFIAHRAGEQGVIVGDVVMGNNGTPTFRLSRRLNNPDGSFRGVASVTIEVDYFKRFYSALNLPPGSTVALIRAQDLTPLIRVVSPGATAPAPMTDIVQLRTAIFNTPNAGRYRGITSNGTERTVAYRTIPNFPLYIKVDIPIEGMAGLTSRQIATRTVPAAMAVSALAFLTWAAFHQASRQRAFQQDLAARVAERTADLESANVRMATLLQELHHRVNNNLQIVESLLVMQAARMNNPQTRASLAPSIGRVLAMGLVHRTMYGSGGLSELAFGDYLRAFVHHLPDIYGQLSPSVTVSGANPILGLEVAVPLALVVHEALSNVVRHAYPTPPQDFTAAVTITEEAWILCLYVIDHGCGLPQSFDWTRGDGLGLTIARSLAAQLGGEIHLTSTTEGTRFELRFPQSITSARGSCSPLSVIR